MKIPIGFPTGREKLEREAERSRRASVDERLEALFDLSSFCESLLASSPDRDRKLRLLEAAEEAEHRAWLAIIERYAGRTS
jgi:hypothetical protein